MCLDVPRWPCLKDTAVDPLHHLVRVILKLTLSEVCQFPPRQQRPFRVVEEPPYKPKHDGNPDIEPDNQIPDEGELVDDSVTTTSRWFSQTVFLWFVEAQGSRREPVRDKVHPEQLNWRQRLWCSKGSCEEDAANLSYEPGSEQKLLKQRACTNV